MKRPLVSVVIPFLNPSPRYLREAVDSVFRQAWPDWEILLVDDGASGEIQETARDLARRNAGRVRYLRHPNGENRGVSAARNLGVKEAAGQLIAFLDADDVWLPEMLAEHVERFRVHPEVGMVYANTLYWHAWTGQAEDRSRDFVPEPGVATEVPLAPPGPLPRFLRGRAAVPCTCSVLVRRELAARLPFEETFRILYTDQVFYAKACLEAPVLVADGCWSRYRQHPRSTCMRASPTELRRHRLAYLEWLERYVEDRQIEDPELRAALRSAMWRARHAWLDRWLRLGRKLGRRSRAILEARSEG